MRRTVGLESIVQRIAAVSLAVALSIVSYRLIERPCKIIGVTGRRRSIAVLIGGTTLMATGFLAVGALFKAQQSLTLTATGAATDWYPYPRDLPYVRQSGFEGRKLFAVGDSHLGAYAGLLHQLSQELGITVRRFHLGDCPMENFLYRFYSRADCDEKRSRIIDAILQEKKSGDIVLFTSLQALRLADQWTVSDRAG